MFPTQRQLARSSPQDKGFKSPPRSRTCDAVSWRHCSHETETWRWGKSNVSEKEKVRYKWISSYCVFMTDYVAHRKIRNTKQIDANCMYNLVWLRIICDAHIYYVKQRQIHYCLSTILVHIHLCNGNLLNSSSLSHSEHHLEMITPFQFE